MAQTETIPHREGIKETLDSIVVALIMAFVFRAFIIEAFVIPTGSMATTLFGKHDTLTCEDCGWEFAYGVSGQVETVDRGRLVKQAPRTAICPNCDHPTKNLRLNDYSRSRGMAESGDRILVFKWPLDLDLGDVMPQRWDVTVFKDPGPKSQNFIKRLVGMPNEVLEIINGDVYVAPVSELSESTLTWLDSQRESKYLLRPDVRGLPSANLLAKIRTNEEAAREELDSKLRISRKSDAAQEALWKIVYHHDYPPRQRDPGQPRWQPHPAEQSAWDTSNRKLVCRGVDETSSVLNFAGSMVDDLCPYNLNLVAEHLNNRTQRYPVSDLRLEFVLVPREGGGALKVGLPQFEDHFWAVIRMDGHVALFRTKGGPPAADAQPLCENRVSAFQFDQPVAMSFEKVDYRVTLEVNDALVLETDDSMFVSDLVELRHRNNRSAGSPVLVGDALGFEMWHVSLWRDTHYTSLGNGRGLRLAVGSGWGTEGKPIWLRDEEYFMLGDNSSASKDSRLWTELGHHVDDRGEDIQLGTVPHDLLIGRAFFVYWPSWQRTNAVPFLEGNKIVPDFGKMRWIR